MADRSKLKKKQWRADGNSMVIGSGHIAFDQQTNCISTGNIIANTQYGGFIRARTQTECNGHNFPEGYLRERDLEPFLEYSRLGRGSRGWRQQEMTYAALERVRGETEDKSIILYSFFHYNGDKRIVHGFILTKTDYEFIGRYVVGPASKSTLVMNCVQPYVSWEEDD